MARADDFEQRRAHLADKSDEELFDYFWELRFHFEFMQESVNYYFKMKFTHSSDYSLTALA